MQLLLVVVLHAVLSSAQYYDPFLNSGCDCQRFCQYQCAINGTKAPVLMDFYRMTMKGVYDLSDKDTGDAAGDTSFVISKKNNAYLCRQNPTSLACANLAQFNGDDVNSTDIILQISVETDGQWGPYLECNPLNISNVFGRWTCEMGIHPPLPANTPPVCSSMHYSMITGYCINDKVDTLLQTTQSDCCAFVKNQTAGMYRAYNYYPNGTCALFKNLSLSKAKPCASDIVCGVYAPPDPNVCECERIYKSVGRQNQATQSTNSFSKAGGVWYSHPSGGECTGDQFIGDGSGCTYKVKAIRRAINATCMYKTIDAFIENLNPKCFGICAKPYNVTSVCYQSCFFATTEMVDKEKLVTPWNNAFLENGCPQVTIDAETEAKL